MQAWQIDPVPKGMAQSTMYRARLLTRFSLDFAVLLTSDRSSTTLTFGGFCRVSLREVYRPLSRRLQHVRRSRAISGLPERGTRRPCKLPSLPQMTGLSRRLSVGNDPWWDAASTSRISESPVAGGAAMKLTSKETKSRYGSSVTSQLGASAAVSLCSPTS